jgi:molecular chaperone HscB
MFPARHPTLRHSLRQLCIHTRTAPFHPATRYTPQAPSRSITTTAIRYSQRTKQCPTCTTPLPLSTSPCPKCATLVPIPTDVSYYSLFDLTPASSSTDPAGESAQERTRRELRALEGGGYVLDTRDLRSRFFKRQQGCHPDSYTGQGKVSRPPIATMLMLSVF